MARIKRSDVKTFVNTTPLSTATYDLLNDGVKTGTPAKNTKTTEETYIGNDTASTTIDSYSLSYPVEMKPDATDPIFIFVDDIRINQRVLDSAQTDIVEVRLYQSSSGGAYPATKHPVVVEIVDGPGGDGGVPAVLKWNFKSNGDPVQGSFNVTSKTFS